MKKLKKGTSHESGYTSFCAGANVEQSKKSENVIQFLEGLCAVDAIDLGYQMRPKEIKELTDYLDLVSMVYIVEHEIDVTTKS